VKTAAGRLAAFATELSWEAIPPDVLDTAALHLLDTLGCGLAAHAMGVATAGRAVAAEMGGAPEATAIGLAGRLPAPQAALANAMLCHGLDWDDTHAGAVCHVGVVVGPAALAAGEARGRAGRDVLAALVAGSEVVARLGLAAGGRFHARGFHATSVCGVVGATAAAARLEGLDPAVAARALGIAGSLASGLLAFLEDGSPTKPIHPGWAAHGAIVATRLARHGAAGPAAVLEGRYGLYEAFVGPQPDAGLALERELADLGDRWETRRLAVKPYPACHYVHGVLGAAEQATGGRPLAPDDIVEVVVTVPEASVPIVLEPAPAKAAPRTPYEGKFSLPYSAAALLVRGALDLGSYTAAAIADPAVLAVARRVRHETRPGPAAAGAFPGGIRIGLRDGRTLEADCPYQKGAPENPLARGEVVRKFRRNAALALPPAGVAALEAAVLGLRRVQDLSAALAPLGDARGEPPG
jgi:2-methylcitrate dehydratase PrpD